MKKSLSLILILILNILIYTYVGKYGIVFLTFSSIITYFLLSLVRKNKLYLILIIIINTIPLLFFKFASFGLIAPLGISYYTLQLISFSVDIYLKKYDYPKNFLEYLLFIYYTPCLFIGPINRYNDLSKQLINNIKLTKNNIYTGMLRIFVGLTKKYIIANSLMIIITTISKNTEIYYGSYVLLAILLYSIQLYADFSGGIDMVIGLSKIFNINIPDNFNNPYSSQSIKDFWRNWHITLGSWLRDYIYIPLGGNRKGRIRTNINLLITFTVSGLWHGVNYIIWGLLNGILVIINFKTKNKYFNICITYILISFLWIFFIYSNNIMAIKMFTSIFINFNVLDLITNIANLGLNIYNLIITSIFIIALIIYDINSKKIYQKFNNLNYDIKIGIFLCFIIIILIFGTYGFGFNGADFIYSKF